MNESALRECAALVGHDFRDVSLLRLALTHASYAAEHDEASNERLEFLGDAVVGLVLADEMYRRHANFDEGVLTDLRKSVVNAETLAVAARRLGLGRFVLLGRGETSSGGADKTSILANAFEAVIGAVHLDAGLATAYELSLRLLAPRSRPLFRACAPSIPRRSCKNSQPTWVSARRTTCSRKTAPSTPRRSAPSYSSAASGAGRQRSHEEGRRAAGRRRGGGVAAHESLARA